MVRYLVQPIHLFTCFPSALGFWRGRSTSHVDYTEFELSRLGSRPNRLSVIDVIQISILVAVPIHSLIEKRLSRMQFTVEILTFEPQLLSPNFTTSMRPGRGPMSRPYGMTWSSDGSLYVASFHTNRILVYARDGRYIGLLPESELLNGPNALLFGRDGALYVTTEGSAYHGSPKNITFPFKSQIVKFDGRRWSVFVDDAERFSSPNRQVSPNFLGLANSPRPDDNLLFVSDFSNGILAFDLKTAELMGRIETSYTGMPSSNGLGSLVFEPKNHFSNYTILAPGFDPLKDNMGCLLTVSFNSTKDIDSAKVSFAAKPNPGLSKPIVIMLHNPTRPQGP